MGLLTANPTWEKTMKIPTSGGSAPTDAQTGNAASTQPDETTTDTPDKGFPEATPIAEMTDAQQAAYWKAQSRKHESEAKARSDYDALKAEVEKFRAANQTDAERAIEDARNESRAAALAEVGTRVVDAYLDARLGDKSGAVKVGINHAAFVDESGDLKLDELTEYLETIAPAEAKPTRDPHQGTRPPQSGPSAADRGRAEAARRFNKTKS